MGQDEREQERRDECRREVRRYLAERPGLAFHARTIQGRTNMTIEEVEASLRFLITAGQAELKHDGLGATRYYKATSAGILAHERGE